MPKYNIGKIGLTISFYKMPDVKVRDELKQNGFQWYAKQKYWYAKETPERLALVRRLCLEANDSNRSHQTQDDYLTPEKRQDAKENKNIEERIKNADEFSDIETVTNNVLYRHQRAGTLLAEMYNKFAFFYDTGTGKTVMTLDIISRKQKKENARFLIIAPRAIIKTAWMDDAVNFYPNLHILPLYRDLSNERKLELLYKWKRPNDNTELPYILLLHTIFEIPEGKLFDGRSIGEELDELADHYILNSELFIRNPEKYTLDLGIDGIIMDESAILKNYDGKTSKLMREVSKDMTYVYLLSGKPAPNNETEYFSQMKIVDPETFYMSYDTFVNRFCYGSDKYMPESKRELFAEMVSARSIIVSKTDCLDLPDCIDVVRQIELPDDVMQDYNSLYFECMALIKGMDESETFYSSRSKFAILMKLRQMASGFFMIKDKDDKKHVEIINVHKKKIAELKRIIEDIGDYQVIIWAQFQYEIELISKELNKIAYTVTAYGKTQDLEGAIDDFKTGRAKYIVANPRTLKYGVTFTNCKYAVYYSFSYSAEDYDQSHDRNYRLGQTEKCTYIYIQSADTIDEIMYARVKYKLSNAEFFEQLIKDASKHGIDYGSLKTKNDEEIKTALYEDGALRQALENIEAKQRQAIIEEYLGKYTASSKSYLDAYEPSRRDVIQAKKEFLRQGSDGDKMTTWFEALNDYGIEDLLLPWDIYLLLKRWHIDTIGMLYRMLEKKSLFIFADEESVKTIEESFCVYIIEALQRFFVESSERSADFDDALPAQNEDKNEGDEETITIPQDLDLKKKNDISIVGVYDHEKGTEIKFIVSNNDPNGVKAVVFSIYVNGDDIGFASESSESTGIFYMSCIIENKFAVGEKINIGYSYFVTAVKKKTKKIYVDKEGLYAVGKSPTNSIQRHFSSDYECNPISVFQDGIWLIKYCCTFVFDDKEILAFILTNKSSSDAKFCFSNIEVRGVSISLEDNEFSVPAGCTIIGFTELCNSSYYDINEKYMDLIVSQSSEWEEKKSGKFIDDDFEISGISIGQIKDSGFISCKRPLFNEPILELDYFDIKSDYGDLTLESVKFDSRCKHPFYTNGYCITFKFLPRVLGYYRLDLLVNGCFIDSAYYYARDSLSEISHFLDLSLYELRVLGIKQNERCSVKFILSVEDDYYENYRYNLAAEREFYINIEDLLSFSVNYPEMNHVSITIS